MAIAPRRLPSAEEGIIKDMYPRKPYVTIKQSKIDSGKPDPVAA